MSAQTATTKRRTAKRNTNTSTNTDSSRINSTNQMEVTTMNTNTSTNTNDNTIEKAPAIGTTIDKTSTLAIAKEMPKFVSDVLNQETKTIFEAISNFNTTATQTRKTVASTLAKIEKGKLYKDDGFKSLAEYAERIGLDKSLTHKMENAGRLLNSEDETIRNFAENADYSKLAIVASAPVDMLKKSIEDGVLTKDSTQQQVREWKAKVKAEQDAKKEPDVLPSYEIDISYGNGETVHYDRKPLEMVDEFDGFVKVGKYSEEGKPTITFMYNPATHKMLRYTATKVKKTAPKKPQVKPMTRSGILAQMEYLKKLLAEQEGEAEIEEEEEA